MCGVGHARGRKGPLAHPSELTYPCCLPALGEFGEMMPHEGSATSLTETPAEEKTRPADGTPEHARPADFQAPATVR